MASIVCEVQWFTYLLQDFRIGFKRLIDLWCDNKAALYITANMVFHERTKHVETNCHVVHEKYCNTRKF